MDTQQVIFYQQHPNGLLNLLLDDNASKLFAEEEEDDDNKDGNVNRKNQRVTMMAPDAEESNAPTKEDVVGAWRDTLHDAKIAKYTITDVSRLKSICIGSVQQIFDCFCLYVFFFEILRQSEALI